MIVFHQESFLELHVEQMNEVIPRIYFKIIMKVREWVEIWRRQDCQELITVGVGQWGTGGPLHNSVQFCIFEIFLPKSEIKLFLI